MITSDAHEDNIHAVGELFSTVPWQRCEFHFSGNIEEKEKLLVVGKEQATMLAA